MYLYSLAQTEISIQTVVFQTHLLASGVAKLHNLHVV